MSKGLTSVTSRIEILRLCNICSLPSPKISHLNRQFICNVLSSRPFLPLSRSRLFLSCIYSGHSLFTSCRPPSPSKTAVFFLLMQKVAQCNVMYCTETNEKSVFQFWVFKIWSFKILWIVWSFFRFCAFWILKRILR